MRVLNTNFVKLIFIASYILCQIVTVGSAQDQVGAENTFKTLWETPTGLFEYLYLYKSKLFGISSSGIYVFDKNTGDLINRVNFNCAQKLSTEASGDHLIVGCDKIVYAISLEDKGKVLWSRALDEIISSISTNGVKIIAGCADGKIHILDSKGNLVFSKLLRKDPIVDVKLADKNNVAAVGTINGRVYLVDTDNGKIIWQNEFEYPVGDLTISPSGDIIVVGSIDDNVYFFRNGKLLWKTYVGGDVCKVVYVPSYGAVFAGTCEGRKDNSVTVINNNGMILNQIRTAGYVRSIAVSRDEKLVAVGSRGFIYLFNGEGSLLDSYKTEDFTAIVFSTAFTDADDLIANIYVPSTGSRVLLFDIPENIYPSKSDQTGLSGYVLPSVDQENIQSKVQPEIRLEYIMLILAIAMPGLIFYKNRKSKQRSITYSVSIKSHPLEILQKEYTILEYLGGGGFADVYKARTKDGNIVALKVPRDLKPEFEEIFLNEVEKWRKLNHRNIVKLIRPRLNPPHLVLEYIDGESLKDRLKRGRLNVIDACKIAYDISRALEYAHSKLIIHTDVNPKNVLLTSYGEAKLTDFGLAKIVTSSSSVKGITLEYSAPEQLKGRADDKTDVYQLGLLLYEMLTGFNPFSAGDIREIERKIMEYIPDPPSKFVDDIEELDDLVMCCLAKNPNDRPSIREFREKVYEFMKKSYGISLHFTKDYRSYAKLHCELAFYAAKEGDLGRALAELKSAREKVSNRETREELKKAIEMLEYMIRENIYSEDLLDLLGALIKQI